MIGGIASSIKRAGVVASILYFQMLIFSGVTVPYEIMSLTMQKIVNIFPLTQGIKLLKAIFLNLAVENVLIPIIAMISISIICTKIAVKYFKWE